MIKSLSKCPFFIKGQRLGLKFLAASVYVLRSILKSIRRAGERGLNFFHDHRQSKFHFIAKLFNNKAAPHSPVKEDPSWLDKKIVKKPVLARMTAANLSYINTTDTSPSTQKLSDETLAVLKRFKISHAEWIEHTTPTNMTYWREQGFIIEEIVIWPRSLRELWWVLAANEILLEAADIEKVHQLSTCQTASGTSVKLVKGQMFNRNLTWITFPIRYEQYSSLVVEHSCLKGQFQYIQMVFASDRDRTGRLSLKIRFTVMLRSPKLKLLVMPMVRHYVNKFKFLITDLAVIEDPLLTMLKDSVETDFETSRYYLSLYHHIETGAVASSKRLKDRMASQFFTTHHERRYFKWYETTWKTLAHYQHHQNLEQPPFPQAQADLLVEPADKNVIKLLRLLARLPRPLKNSLAPLSIAKVLDLPAEQVLKLFAQACALGFLDLRLRSICPLCLEYFEIDRAALTQPTSPEIIASSHSLDCPFCTHVFKTTLAELESSFMVNEEHFYHNTNRSRDKEPSRSLLSHSPVMDNLLLEEQIAADTKWSRQFLLDAGTYRLICGGSNEPIVFTMREPTLKEELLTEAIIGEPNFKESLTTKASPMPHLPLVCTGGGKLVRIDFATERTGNLEGLVFSGIKLRINIDTSVHLDSGDIVIRLIKMPSILCEQVQDFVIKEQYDILSLERMFPYFIKYAPTTLYELSPASKDNFHFQFKKLPFLLYQAHLPSRTSASIVTNGTDGESATEHEKKWLNDLIKAQGVTAFSGFWGEWLYLVPNKDVLLRHALAGFEHFFYANIPVKLILGIGGGTLFEEFDPELASQWLVTASSSKEVTSWLPPKKRQITGAIWDQFKILLSVHHKPGLMVSAEFFKMPLMEKWLREHKVDINRMARSKSVRAVKKLWEGEERKLAAATVLGDYYLITPLPAVVEKEAI
ncbi:hypothetical protein COTS27_00110 [Spirochaetota bacterium]|nr:hypothetical protein COTS27_00110 [Spirochaetota bacterium]